jgi:hypothetical protein
MALTRRREHFLRTIRHRKISVDHCRNLSHVAPLTVNDQVISITVTWMPKTLA